METMWIVSAEVLVEPGDMPSGCTKAFVNITTWAESVDALSEKISRYLEAYKWCLISIDAAHPVDEKRSYEEEIDGMIERARDDPRAIVLGSFFSYKEN